MIYFRRKRKISRFGIVAVSVVILLSVLMVAVTAGCNEDTAQGHLSSGYQLLEKGFDDRAIEQFTKSMKYDDSLAGAYAWRGVAYTHKQEWELAGPDFTQALELDSELDWIYSYRATAYAETGQWVLALADADEALSLDSFSDRAYRARAMACMALGDIDCAVVDYKMLIAVSTNEEWLQQANEALSQMASQGG